VEGGLAVLVVFELFSLATGRDAVFMSASDMRAEFNISLRDFRL
jgi:hypothetical protein